MTAGPYAHAWEAYRAAGWTGVIPLPPRAKADPPRGVTGNVAFWPSYADCASWADGREGAGNIALRLPHGVIGLDVDNYDGKPGAATFAAAEAHLGALPATWRATSRGDGISGIRLYRVPEGLAWPGQLGPATEIIQHRHRYAVVWPSVHPEGRTYRWISPDGLTSTGVPDVDQLPELPPAWVEGLNRGDATAPGPRNDYTGAQVQQWLVTRRAALEQPCARMTAALTGARMALAAGSSAHDTTTSAVMRAVRLADEGHGGIAVALGDLHTVFAAETTRTGRAGHTRTPAEAGREWRDILRSAVSKVSATPTGLDSCDCDGRLTQAIVDAAGPPLPGAPVAQIAGTSALNTQPHPTQPQPDPAQPEPQPDPQDQFIEDQIKLETLKLKIREEARRRLRREHTGAQSPPSPVLLDAFLAVDDEPERYRIEGLWPVGGRVMLTAQFKAGKTTLVGNLVRSLVDAEPFLDRFLTHPPAGRIAIIDNELDDRMLRRWLRDQRIGNTGQVAVLPLRGKLSTFDLIDPETRTEWANKLREVGATIAVVDCLAPILDALGLSEDKEAGRFLVALDEFAKEAGIEELVLVHHMGHGTERARGASRLRDWPDVEWKLTREKNEDGDDEPSARRYFSAYGRDVDVAESALDFVEEQRRLLLAGGSRKEAGNEEILRAVVAYVRDNQGASGRQIELFTGQPQKKTRAALQTLVARGKVSAVKHGGGVLYSLPVASISGPPPTSQNSSASPDRSIAENGAPNDPTSADLGKTVAELKDQVNGGARQSSATPRQEGGEELGNGAPLRGGAPVLPNCDPRPPGGVPEQTTRHEPGSPQDVDDRIRRALGDWGTDP